MQILKDDIRNSILISAKDLFLEFGFLSTSVDKIAQRAGVSKSNLYNYFENKESIFNALVAETVTKLVDINEYFAGIDFDLNTDMDVFLQKFVYIISELLDSERDSLLLILDSAAGTKYAAIVDNIIALYSEKFSKRIGRNKYPQLFSKSLATNLIKSIILILKQSKTKQELVENLTALSIYHTYGFKALTI